MGEAKRAHLLTGVCAEARVGTAPHAFAHPTLAAASEFALKLRKDLCRVNTVFGAPEIDLHRGELRSASMLGASELNEIESSNRHGRYCR